MVYLNTNRAFEINSEIIEWDIHSAGISIIQEYQLLSNDKINKLKKLPKDRMNISIGKIGQEDKDFSRILEEKFNEVIKIFLTNNDLDIEYDILSIKRDAAFTINREVKHPTIGEFITFVPKNTYHAYLYIKPYEFLLKRDGSLDVKGLVGDREVRQNILSLHENGIINFINELINLCEGTNLDSKKINTFCAEFIRYYKNKELDFDYYREFTLESAFRYNLNGNEMMMKYIDSNILNNIDISYNYINLILPIINLVC